MVFMWKNLIYVFVVLFGFMRLNRVLGPNKDFYWTERERD